jgi:type III pantothenate kinase
MITSIQIGLAIGNSRYHWAWFLNTKFQSSWDTEYIVTDRFWELLPIDLQMLIKQTQLDIDRVFIYLISVVPSQTAIWQQLPQVKQISLSDIPLLNLYPTLGIDRALAGFGAGEIYGYPVLVIDGGTALTITGIDQDRRFVGGAIMPGLRLQLRSLAIGTAALPEIELPQQLPPCWSDNTPGSITSGILHTVSAGISYFIQDWQQLFPKSQIVFTGGDGDFLAGYLQSKLPSGLNTCTASLQENFIRFDRHLLFYGLSAILS